MVRRVSVLVLVLVATLWPASAWAAYVTPTSRSTGFVVTAARWNQDVVDNMIAVRTAVRDSVVNETAGTDMTITATGDEIIFADQIKLLGTTSDPTNEMDVSYDSTDCAVQVKYGNGFGRVTLPGTFFRVTSDSTAVTASGFTAFSNGTTSQTVQFISGTLVEFEAGGTWSTGVTGTDITFTIRKGSTDILKIICRPTNSQSGTFHVHGHITGRSSTTVYATGFAGWGNATFGNRDQNAHDSSVGVATVSSSAETLSFGITMGGTDDSVVLKTGYMRVH